MFARTEQDQALLRVVLVGVFVLVVPLALITTTIRAVISEQAVYDYSVRHYDADAVTGVSESQLINANNQIHDYLVDPDAGPLAPQVTASDGTTEPLFNAKETSHMADVRDLVQAMFQVQVLAVALSLTLAVVIMYLWSVRVLAAGMLWSAAIVAAVLGAGGVLAATGFDAAWSDFHVIAFSNDLWQLDPRTDHLIQMFPERFWEQVTLWIGGAILLEAFVMAVLSAGFLLLTREHREHPMHEPLDTPDHRPELPGRSGHAPRLSPPDSRNYIR